MSRHLLLALLVGLLVTTGCAGRAAMETQAGLDTALATAPADTTMLLFTDWARIKAYENRSAITSQSPLDERRALLLTTAKTEAAASGFGVQYLDGHAETWGWDSTDLEWEAALTGQGAPVYVLRLRADLDLAAIEAKFVERDFTKTSRESATIYSHELDLGAEWIRSTDLAIVNTAIVADQHLLVISSALDRVEATVDSIVGKQSALDENEAAKQIAQAIGETGAAALLLGGAQCAGLDPVALLGRRATPDMIAQLREQLANPALKPYEALGIGYRKADQRATGTIVMHYASADDAQTALPARQKILAEGSSLATQQPYSDLLTNPQGKVEGTDLVITVQPRNDMPRVLFDMVLRQDLLFAACS